MIEKKDFDTIRKASLIYNANFNNYIFTYTYQHRRTEELLEVNAQLEAGNLMYLCGVGYYQVDGQGSYKSRFKATRSYKVLKNNKVSLRGIKPKDDGTTGQKLQTAPLLEALISPSV